MDKDTFFHSLICLSPAVWIGFAFLSRAVFMLKGYPTTEGLMMGCLFGPLGAVIGLLVPRYSQRVYKALRNTGLLFAFIVFNIGSFIGLLYWKDPILFLISAVGACATLIYGIVAIAKGKWG